MRQLIFNPSILLSLVAIGIIYLLIISRFSNRANIHSRLRHTTIFLFLLTGLDLTIPPFVYLYPDALAGFDKTVSSSILQLSIYIFFVFILRSWFATFLKSTLLLFKDPFLGLLLLVAVLSEFWSDTPGISLRAGLALLLTSALSAHIVKGLNWQELAKLLRWLVLVSAILSVLLIGIAPSIALNGKGLSGIFPFPIKLGTCMALGISLWFSCLLDHRKNRLRTAGIIAFLLILLIAANSGQGFLTCFVLVSLVGLLRTLKKMGRLAFIVILFYASISVLLIVGEDSYIPAIFGALGKDTTLTGRTDFWPQLIVRLMEHPAFGYGLNSFWQPWRGVANPAAGIINPSSGFAPPHAHNGFLDLALSLGLIGLLLFSLSLVIGLVKAIRYFMREKSSAGVIPLIFLLYVVIANVSETQLLGSSYIWILYVMTVTRLNVKASGTEVGAGKSEHQTSAVHHLLPTHFSAPRSSLASNWATEKQG